MTICGQRWVRVRRLLAKSRRFKRMIWGTQSFSPLQRKLLQVVETNNRIIRLLERTSYGK